MAKSKPRPLEKENVVQGSDIEIGWGSLKIKTSPLLLLGLLLGFVIGIMFSFGLVIYAQQPALLIEPMISKAVTQTLAAQPVTPTPHPTDTPPVSNSCGTYDLKITSPTHNATVEETEITISGSYSTRPPEDIVVFTIKPPGGDKEFWPQKPVQIDQGRQTWEGSFLIFGELPLQLDVMVAIMGESGDALVEHYRKVGAETGKYPSIAKLTEDIIECDRITVTRVK